MALLDLASGKSLWRGLGYYRDNKVLSVHPTGDSCYEGEVARDNKAHYTVRIDTAHPRKSSCNCPHAEGRRFICKHQVALYFAAVPGSEEQFLKDVEEEEREYEQEMKRWYADQRKRITQYVNGLTAKEARSRLIDMLIDQENERSSPW